MLRRMSSMANKPHTIRTAAAMIIGDEVLNGKIKDTNSLAFARYCFELGIDLRRIIVVPDIHEDIASTLNYLRQYDFIVTTGGIGPTHDDITYESIAQAYGLKIGKDQETISKMDQYANHKPMDRHGEELKAQLRMATFPVGPLVKTYYPMEKSWVPVVSLENKVYIFPGIPTLFHKMLDGIRQHIAPRVDSPPLERYYVSTVMPESGMAAVLSDIHNRYSDRGIKIGSYPHYHDHRNTVSLIGPSEESKLLEELVEEIKVKVNGRQVSAEEESKAW